MPELPEVEVVRRGLAAHLESRTFADVAVTGPRAVRRHAAGPEDFAARVRGARIRLVRRRGKYLWLDLASDEALVAHLGMSGQLLLAGAGQPDPKHVHARFTFDGGGIELRFVDQRTFGVLFVAETDDDGLPLALRHIAPDPFDPLFDAVAVAGRMTKSASGIKRLLLNQTVVSGIGNIYADEALWRAQIHGDRPGDRLTRPVVGRLLDHAREVMHDALGEGGTSFDSLYVDVNGESGYFDRSLDVYGREGQPCRRCGTTIRREQFMNRSSFSCPHCQPRPRRRR